MALEYLFPYNMDHITLIGGLAILYGLYYIFFAISSKIRLFYITASTAPTIKNINCGYSMRCSHTISQVTRHFQHCFRLFFVFT